MFKHVQRRATKKPFVKTPLYLLFQRSITDSDNSMLSSLQKLHSKLRRHQGKEQRGSGCSYASAYRQPAAKPTALPASSTATVKDCLLMYARCYPARKRSLDHHISHLLFIPQSTVNNSFPDISL